MSISFNADEILAMAEKIEADGAAFYRRAAELKRDQAELLLRLAAMEDQHRASFAAMRSKLDDQLREQTTADPYLEAEMYLQAMAGAHGGEGAPAATAALTGKESVESILRTAVDLEAKSIVFYLGLKDLVPAKFGKGKVDKIIAEEKLHMTMLAGELKKLRGDA